MARVREQTSSRGFAAINPWVIQELIGTDLYPNEEIRQTHPEADAFEPFAYCGSDWRWLLQTYAAELAAEYRRRGGKGRYDVEARVRGFAWMRCAYMECMSAGGTRDPRPRYSMEGL